MPRIEDPGAKSRDVDCGSERVWRTAFVVRARQATLARSAIADMLGPRSPPSSIQREMMSIIRRGTLLAAAAAASTTGAMASDLPVPTPELLNWAQQEIG
eukprot:COSAG02_NODE_20172_length_845_cov_1.286863_3_plen_99_part_01